VKTVDVDEATYEWHKQQWAVGVPVKKVKIQAVAKWFADRLSPLYIQGKCKLANKISKPSWYSQQKNLWWVLVQIQWVFHHFKVSWIKYLNIPNRNHGKNDVMKWQYSRTITQQKIWDFFNKDNVIGEGLSTYDKFVSINVLHIN
jgi:hypothetical protein